MNYLVNLGWNDGTTKEIYTAEELIESFSIDRVVRSAAVFDVEKLNWVNAHHMKLLHHAELCKLLEEVLMSGDNAILPATLSSTEDNSRHIFIKTATKIGQPLLTVTNDIRSIITDILEFSFMETMELPSASLNSESEIDISELSVSERKKSLLAAAAVVKEILNGDFISLIKIVVQDIEENSVPTEISPNAAESWKQYVSSVSKRSNRKGKALFHPLRLILTGRLSGPDVGMQLQLLHAADGVVASGVNRVSLQERALILRNYVESTGV